MNGKAVQVKDIYKQGSMTVVTREAQNQGKISEAALLTKGKEVAQDWRREEIRINEKN
jgi:hypothetical protein